MRIKKAICRKIAISVVGLMIIVLCLSSNASLVEEHLGIDFSSADILRMGEINSASLWLDGVLVGAASGVFYYPDNSQEAQYLPLPSDEKALQSAHLTAILTQNMDAYALSLSAEKLWPLVWDGKILNLDTPKQFDTSAFLYQNEQGIESIWIPEQVLLSGETLCILSRYMRSLDGTRLMLIDLPTGEVQEFPRQAGQQIRYLSLYDSGQLLALVQQSGSIRIQQFDLKNGTQTPYAKLEQGNSPVGTAILYHENEDALYILEGTTLFRRDASGKVEEIAYMNVGTSQFIRFGRLSWYNETSIVSVFPEGLKVRPIVDIKRVNPLVVLGVDERDPAHIRAIQRLGNTPVRVRHLDWSDGPEKLAEIFIGRLSEPDVLFIESDFIDLPRLMEKGYALNLSSQNNLAAFAQTTYSQIQSQCFRDGLLFLLPVSVQYVGPCLDLDAFASLELNPPGSVKELADLLTTWQRYADEWSGYSLFPYGTPRGFLVDAVWQAWLTDRASKTQTIGMETPEFKELLLDVIEDTDFRYWPKTHTDENTVVLLPDIFLNAFDLKRWTTYYRVASRGERITGFANIPLALSLSDESKANLPVRVTYMCINPYSMQPDLALKYMNHYLEGLSAEQRILLCPNENQPVSNPLLPLMIQNAENDLLLSEQTLAMAAPDADIHSLEERVRKAKETLSWWQTDPPVISSDAIVLYRKLMGYSIVMTYENSAAAARKNLEPLLTSYRMGTINVDTFILEGSRILHMIKMEDE